MRQITRRSSSRLAPPHVLREPDTSSVRTPSKLCGDGTQVNMLSVACRRAVLVLVIAVPVMGMPVPASAAGEGDGGVSRQRPLAINGRPLARTITSAANGMLTLQIAAARVPPAIVLTRSQQGSSPNRSWVGLTSGALRCDCWRGRGCRHCRSDSPRGSFFCRLLRWRRCRRGGRMVRGPVAHRDRLALHLMALSVGGRLDTVTSLLACRHGTEAL